MSRPSHRAQVLTLTEARVLCRPINHPVAQLLESLEMLQSDRQ